MVSSKDFDPQFRIDTIAGVDVFATLKLPPPLQLNR